MGCAGCTDCTLPHEELVQEALTKELPYELHVTVEQNRSFEYLQQLCAVDGSRGLRIRDWLLATKTENQIGMLQRPGWRESWFTKKPYKGTVEGAMHELREHVRHLYADGLGFKILRSKIETVPWHPYARQASPDDLYNSESYFEAHYKIDRRDDQFDRRKLLYAAKWLGLHLSSNPDQRGEVFATYRSGDVPVKTFQFMAEKYFTTLDMLGFMVHEPRIEYAFLDTNPDFDTTWTG